ncbi:anhydro-N-acetylmuramic acid kinase [Candidatus Ruthia endofausta]|uniref:Anhydro-N-acetylmuramic acid kinase n=1 Tax=Candidatus Ruthia endofausta TaxID=2738852 RepID=A0A6N0HQK8_9GAMM|nr:anhydro-N-acetylmuramic acid kinase [Candidatus Ruthia endofausta]QKQ24597.1 anhydro-N-acetylmuramic acid kinase [Candidatus Ruthia endofausta]
MANYIGLMSGTSLDGVDGVIINETGRKIITQAYLPYPEKLKQSLLELTQSLKTSLENLANIDIQIASCFSDTVHLLLQQGGFEAKGIKAIGSHGQSVFHQGGKYSMQIGHGALIAEKTSITTVADFRMQDVAAGGQGAPLTPLYHQHMLNGKDGVIINLGGIANITHSFNGEVIGFDTGPANTLLDHWIKKNKNLDYDRDGIWSRSGLVSQALLNSMLSDDYFHKDYPKSTGPEYFNLDWLSQHLNGTEPPEDVQRTLIELTAISISENIPSGADVYFCGGGVHNLFLFERLSYQNPDSKVTLTNDLGVFVDYVEAAAFGFFAQRTLEGLPSNLPSVTGAKSERVLGAIYAI